MREVIERVALDLGVQWVELSILEDSALFDAYRDLIPVILVDGVRHSHWRVDESRLRRALAGSAEEDLPGA